MKRFTPSLEVIGALGLILAVTGIVVLSISVNNDLLRTCQGILRWLGETRGVGASMFVLAMLLTFGVLRVLLYSIGELRMNQRFSRYLGQTAATQLFSTGVVIIDTPDHFAFTKGLFTPTTYLSSGLLRTLTPEEQQAVFAHEAHHRLRRDPLRLLLWRLLDHFLLFLPLIRSFARRAATVIERKADEATLVAGVGRDHLIRAIEKSLAVGGTIPTPMNSPFAQLADHVERLSHLVGSSGPPRRLVVPALSTLFLILVLSVPSLATATRTTEAETFCEQSKEENSIRSTPMPIPASIPSSTLIHYEL